jgi:HYR domain
MDKLFQIGRYIGLFIALNVLSQQLIAADALIVGRNTNIIGPPVAMDSVNRIEDKGLRQQNEPSCAINPENPKRICCGFNDYRGVDIPGLEDAWEGIACSIDGGDSWNSELIPGHRNDPEHSLGLEFAADPNLVGVPGGLIFNYIAANRDQVGGLYVQRYAWKNKEDGWPVEPVGGPVLVSKGTSGRFIDKPHAHGIIDDNSTETVSWTWTNEDGPQSRELSAGSLGISAAVFVGNDNNDGTKILYWRSNDWGATFEQPTKFTESIGVNSGVNLSAKNATDMCAIWRRFDDSNESSAVLFACSTNGGKKFSKPKVIQDDICPFDQTTLNGLDPTPNIVSFRSNAFPVLANDGGNYYAFWADRGYAAASDGPEGCTLVETDPATGEPRFNESFSRIVFATSSNGKTWSAPEVVEDYDGISVPGQQLPFAGHQFMPTAFGANGEVVLAWIDTRADIVNAFRTPGFDPDIDKQLIVDLWGENDGTSAGLYRHTADIRSVRLTNGAVQGASTQVSQYARGLMGSGQNTQLVQLEYNLVNARLFQNGFAPFVGDYLHMTASAFNKDIQGNWKNSNTLPVPGGVFHVSWADNRDVRGNAWGDNGFASPSPYTPAEGVSSDGAANSTGTVSTMNPSVEDDPLQSSMACSPGDPAQPSADRTRDQNVYSAALYPEFTLNSPGAIKLSGSGIDGQPLQRAIPVLVENHSSQLREIQLTIQAQPGGNGKVTFSQFKTDVVASVKVKVWPKSSAVRTVFVTTEIGLASTGLPVSASICSGGDCNTPAIATVLLNESPLALEQPDFGNSSIAAQETHDPRILNPGLLNPDVVRLLILDPGLIEILRAAGLVADTFGLADLFNPGLVDPATLTLLETYPDLLNPEALDPALLALLLDNPRLLNTNLLLTGATGPGSLSAELLVPGLLNDDFWALLRADNNLSVLIDAVADPDFLNLLVENPNLLNPNLLNLVLANPNLLNPNLLNILVANPNLLNFELANPNLLNPNLLNILVSNPNLLNTSVSNGLLDVSNDPGYPAAGTAQEQVDYVELNYAGNPDLVNAVLANPNLLNPNLLNPNLLNPNLLNQVVANPNLLNPNLLNPNLLNPNLLNPNLLNPNLLNPDLLNPDLLNLVLTNPNLLNQIVANPNLLNPNLLNPNLLNPNLLNQLVANPNLLNPNLLNPNLLNPNLLNPNLLNAPLDDYNQLENVDAVNAPSTVTPGEDYYIDVTWQVQNQGNTTTGYMAQPYVAGAEQEGSTDGITGTQLIVSKPYLRQTVVDCQQVLQTHNNILVNIPNPRILPPLINPDPTDPTTTDVVEQLGSFWLAPGEVANVTLRTFGEPDSLISGRTGLYINSEACTSGVPGAECSALLPFALVERDATAPEFDDLTAFYAQFEIPIEANAPGGGSVDYITPTATDEGDGGAVQVVCDFAPGEVFPLGTSSHTCTATDTSGNEQVIDFDVEIVDTVPPVLTVSPDSTSLPIQVEATGPTGANYTFAEFNGWVINSADLVDTAPDVSCSLINTSDPQASPIPLTLSDPDGNGDRAIQIPAGLALGFGTYDLSCISTDNTGTGGGNSSAPVLFNNVITLADTIAPVITVPMANVVVSSVSPQLAVASFVTDATDVVGVSSFSCIDSTGSEVVSGQTLFPLGVTAITCTASDAAGNSSQQVFNVEVLDSGLPQLNLPASMVFPAGLHPSNAQLGSGYQVAYAATATDAWDSNVDVACAPLPGWFIKGVTRVDCVATDDAGNSSAGFFTVTVQDTTSPSVTPPADIFAVEATSAAGAAVSYSFTALDDVDATLDAACSDSGGNNYPASTTGVQFPLGVTTVSCTFSDDDGNSASGAFSVEVVDTTAPVFTVTQGDITASPSNASGVSVAFTLAAEDFNNVSEPVDITCSANGSPVSSGDTFGIGTTTVSCTATDQQGNSAGTQFNVTVNTSIVWLAPSDNGTPHVANIGPNIGLLWGYGQPGALLNSRSYLDKPGGKGTQPLMMYYLGNDNSCQGNDQGIVDLDAGSSSLRYGGGEWQLNWQTGQSQLDTNGDGVADADLIPGCYRLEIPRISGIVDSRLFILN